MNRLIYMVDQNDNRLECNEKITHFCTKYGLQACKILKSLANKEPILLGASLVRFKMSK